MKKQKTERETGMRKLNTIQKRHNLNTVYAADDKGAGEANHIYVIECHAGDDHVMSDVNTSLICFQHGPRNEANSIAGVLDTDLLEIVRDRLKSFQEGAFATRENAIALTHIEEALLWLNKRVEDRAERGVLGTNQP